MLRFPITTINAMETRRVRQEVEADTRIIQFDPFEAILKQMLIKIDILI